MQPTSIIPQSTAAGLIAPQNGTNHAPKTAPTPPLTRISPRQAALGTARQAIAYLLFGEPLPQTFDRHDLKQAAAELGAMLAELEVLQ